MAYFNVLLQHSAGESEGMHTEYSDKLANSSNLSDIQYDLDASVEH